MTTKSERDRSIERLLQESRPQLVGDAACLDAETIAAFADGGLNETEQALVERHAADCARCQAMLAVLAKAQALPPPRPWWQPAWNVGWLVPVAAGAAAVAIWVAVPHQSGPSSSLASPSQPPSLGGAKGPGKPAEPEKRADQAPPDTKDRDGVGARTTTERKDAKLEASRREAEKAATTDERKSLRDKQAGIAKEEPPPPATDSLGRAAAPAPPAARFRTLEQSSAARNQAAAAAESFAPVREIVSSDPAIRWRIGRGGLIQRSGDAGASWETLPSAASTDLLAAASPSPTICWVVGRGATVLRSTDGRRFERIAFPGTADLSAVRASDARTATVTTVEGRTFRTTDGGATWSEP